MRKIIISFCILFAALSLQAQSVNGIRIDGGNTPILVYLGGSEYGKEKNYIKISFILMGEE